LFLVGDLVLLDVADDYFYPVDGTEVLCELLGEVDGAVLAAGAAEGDHEVFEASALVAGDAAIYEGEDAGQVLLHTLLAAEVVDDRLVFAGEGLEAIFAAGVGEAAGVKDEAAAVAGLVGGGLAMEAEAEDADG